MRPLLLVSLALLAPPPGSAAEATFTLKYRSTTYAYLDAGRSQGLSVGDRLNVLEGADAVGELEVVFLADQSASCRVVSEKRTLRAGDIAVLAPRPGPGPVPAAVELAPGPEPPAPTELTSPPKAAVAAPAGPWLRARGGVSLGYYRVWDQSARQSDYQQQTGRADLSLWEIGNQPLSFDLRYRGRQDVRSLPLSARSERIRSDRLYEASFRYEPPSDDFALEVGRLGTSRFLSVGYLDGAFVRFRVAPVLQLGGFYGRRSEYDFIGLQGAGPSYGGFLRFAPRGRFASSYEAILAVIREFAANDVSREYASLETRFQAGRRVSLYQRAEVDLNRGWRATSSDQRYQLSFLSVSANMRLNTANSAILSYDSRRNYRDFYTRNVPENVFDDLLHRGFHLGYYHGQAYGMSFTGNLGVRLKEQESENAYSMNLGARHGNLWGSNSSLSLDASGFANGFTRGYLLTGSFGKRFARANTFDFSYSRSFYEVRALAQRRHTEWLRLIGRTEFGRHVYALGDLEYDRGDDLRGPRAYVELGFQF